jgi:Na+/proline symporter/archaellum biogenesis ATPase FlaH
MISYLMPVAAMVLYLLLLFGLAYYADRKREAGESIVTNPYVYALSLCVYCSAWTFYGSIGRAAEGGLGFLPIYLGPTLVMIIAWQLIRKMIRISKELRLTSVSDFISFRYGRSYAIGSLVTVLSMMVIIPYIALQLIAISNSVEILSGGMDLGMGPEFALAALLGIFAIFFGARHLDSMERHEGLIAAIAFESIIKLLAFLAVGIFITYGIFDGYGEIISRALTIPSHLELIRTDYVTWFTLTLVSAFAILFLPRQFHVMIVENSDERHLRKAMWIFPLYMLLINLFVPAIAGAGLLLKTPGVADMFIISIPFQNGSVSLAILAFIGGTSAATAMVLVDSVAVGTMMLHELEMPHMLRLLGKGRDLPGLLLNLKRLNILLVVALAFIYSKAVAYQNLADIGLVSFLAASQMAPAAIGGLYWKNGNRAGAIAGLLAGFLLWIYTAFFPSLSKVGWISSDFVNYGPFGIEFLRPTALFGMQLDIWTHSAFWTLLTNCALYIMISLMFKPTPEEALQAESFVDVYSLGDRKVKPETKSIRIGTVDELEATLARYIGDERAKVFVEADLSKFGVTRDRIDARQIIEMWDRAERLLTGSLGPSATRIISEDTILVTPVMEQAKETVPEYELIPGKVYIVPNKAYELFTDQITHGIEGLCLTSKDPEEVRRNWGFSETPIIRLSHLRGGIERNISPNNLPLIFLTVKAFVEESRNSVVLLDSLEELIKENEGLIPEAEILDFVNQIEQLSKKGRMRLVLAGTLGYYQLQKSGEINEMDQLLFAAGPLPSYLIKVFGSSMIAASKGNQHDILLELNRLLASGDLIGTSRASAESDGYSCDPDMRAESIRPETAARKGLEIDQQIRFSRREFFRILRRIGKVILRLDPAFDIKAALGPMMDKYGFSRYELLLTPGTTYGIQEEKPSKSLEIFSKLVHLGMDGLCLSRYNPDSLYERYDISPKNVIWLTQRLDNEDHMSVDPTNFPRLSSIVSEFLKGARDPIVLMEGLGYLITQSNYETVLRFIQSQRDDIALRDAILLIHIDPLSLDTKELHRLQNELEPLEL